MRFGLSAFLTTATLDPASAAQQAEAAGFVSLLFADHTHIPLHGTSVHPSGGPTPPHYADIHDPFIASALAAAATERLLVGTGVCLLAARDPIVVAKQSASIDVLSGGRFVLGVGAGWNAEEIADHGVDPAQRWSVVADRVAAIKAIWTEDPVSYDGPHVRFGSMRCGPRPFSDDGVRRHPPVVVGGHGPGVLERTIAYGDEWLAMPSRGAAPLADRIARLRELADAAGRAVPAVSVQVFGDDPSDAVIEKYRVAGVSRIDFGVPHGGPEQMAEAIERLGRVVREHA